MLDGIGRKLVYDEREILRCRSVEEHLTAGDADLAGGAHGSSQYNQLLGENPIESCPRPSPIRQHCMRAREPRQARLEHRLCIRECVALAQCLRNSRLHDCENVMRSVPRQPRPLLQRIPEWDADESGECPQAHADCQTHAPTAPACPHCRDDTMTLCSG
jgi:hypothetical protein